MPLPVSQDIYYALRALSPTEPAESRFRFLRNHFRYEYGRLPTFAERCAMAELVPRIIERERALLARYPGFDGGSWYLSIAQVTGRLLDYISGGGSVPAELAQYLPADQYGALVPVADNPRRAYAPHHTQSCPNCAQHYSPDEAFSTVWTGAARYAQWCASCSSDESTLCSGSGRRYSDGEYQLDYVAGSNDRVLRSWARDHSWALVDSDGDSIDEDDLDDDEAWYWVRRSASAALRIPEYHRASRPSFELAPVFRKPQERTYGIELEVEFIDNNARQRYFSECHTGGEGLDTQRQFTAEIDGSLNRHRGLEIIGGAFPLSSYYAEGDANPWKRKCAELYKYGAIGWAVRAKYGMHINVDMRPLGMTLRDAQITPELLMDRYSRLTAFFHNNRVLSQIISGRRVIFGHDAISEGYSRKHSLADARADSAANKYVPCRIRPNKVVTEVRIFGSNVRFEGILRNVEFVDSIMHYVTSSEANLFAGASSASYRQWLLRPENANRWKYITAYLTPRAADPKLLAIRKVTG